MSPDLSGTSPVGDDARLNALAAFGILDTPPERGFDDIVNLARRLCDVPVALVSLVDRDRQWFKARAGFPPCETDLDRSVCKFVLAEPDILQIPDLARDPRTRDNPLVTGEPHLRFYAGAPLLTPEGQALGSLCVIDHVPRFGGLTRAQADDLRMLAHQVMDLLLLRRALAERDRKDSQREAVARTLAEVTAGGGDLDANLRAALAGAMHAVPAAEAGAIEIREAEELVYRAVTDGLAAHLGLRLPLDGSLAGACLHGDAPLLVPDVRRDERVKRDVVESLRLRSCVLVPVRRGGVPIGVLKLQASRPGAFTEEDLRVAEIFAGTVAAGLAEAGEETALRTVKRRERRYAAVFDSAIDHAIVVMDRDGIITEWNEGAKRILGWTVDEVLGGPADLFFTPEDREAGIPALEMEEALRTGSGNDERWHLRKDGMRFFASGEMMVLREEDGRMIGFLKILRDRTERHEAGKRLEASQRSLDLERRLLRAIFDQAPVGISVAGATSEVPTLINARAEAMLGHGVGEPGEARYTGYGALHADGRPYAPEDYPTVRALRDGASVRGEALRYRNAKTGEVRQLEVSSGPVLSADGTVLAAVTVFADVEDQRQAEADLRKLAAIVEQSRDFVGIARPDGTADFLNEAGRNLVGLPNGAAAMATRVLDYFPPEDHAIIRDVVMPAVDRDGYWEGDLHFRHFVTGAKIPVHYTMFPVRDGSGALSGYGTVTRDLSEQNRSREALQASDASLRAVLDTVPVGILFAEAPSGRIVGGNRRLEEIFRHPVLPSPDADSYGEWVAFHADGRRVEPYEYPLSRIIREGAEHAALECQYQRGDGTRVWIEIVGVPMRDADGKLTGGVVAVADVDARRKAEAHQELLNNELSHRMKNLLAMVQAISASTLRGATDIDAAREVLGSRLVALGKAHDVLLGGAAESAPLSAVVREGVGVQEAAGERVVYEGPDVDIGGKAALSLALTLHELTTNAVKYGALSVPEGRVSLTASLVDAAAGPDLRIAWRESGGPPVVPPSRKGFGSRLIERGLTAQVSARLALDYRRDGVSCVIEAPLANFQAVQ